MIRRFSDNSTSLFWLLNIGGWAGYAVLNYLMGIAGYDKQPDYIGPSLMYAAGGFAITFGLRLVYKAAWNLRPAISLPISAAGAVAAAVLFASYRTFAYVHVYDGDPIGSMPLSEYFHTWELTLSLYVIGTWSGLYFGIKNYRMAEHQREQALKASNTAKEAQLRTLRYQLNPHFLFNTLNAISTLVLEGENANANRMLTRLSAFLRHSLDKDPMQKIRLADEVAALDLYLGLEQMRFDDRLEIRVDIDEEASGALVPGMILQPLIENAVLRTISASEAGGSIAVAGKARDAILSLSVVDNGSKIPDGVSPRSRLKSGPGLASARERLQVLYGDAHSFSVTEVQPHGLNVEIRIPFERFEQ